MCSFLFAYQLGQVTLKCFFLDYKKVDYDTNHFLLTPHDIVISTSTKKKNSVQLVAMIGTNCLFARHWSPKKKQLMLLTGACPVVNTNTNILNKS